MTSLYWFESEWIISENNHPNWTFDETKIYLNPEDPESLLWGMQLANFVEDLDEDDQIIIGVELGEAKTLFTYDGSRISVRASTIDSF